MRVRRVRTFRFYLCLFFSSYRLPRIIFLIGFDSSVHGFSGYLFLAEHRAVKLNKENLM